MSAHNKDIIDQLAGVKAGSSLDHLRARRPVTKEQAQASWEVLFQPANETEISITERLAVGLFVSELHGDVASRKLYETKLKNQPDGEQLADIIRKIAQTNKAEGPYGHFPQGPLSAEDQDGPSFVQSKEHAQVVSQRLWAALTHAHFLVFHPRDANPDRLKILTNAGWSATGIITLSQLISFLAFQLRVVSGLKILAEA
ncbi:CMD domain protein [Paenochrobactrum sp. BZR 588]|uniref:CMD domain protein n=1 Tax=Paenochrobactrum TaxID=999488 RepID=UPI0035BC594A